MKGTTWEDWDSELKSSPEAREAFELNKQAALGAEIRALNNTANMLASGVGVERDLVAAEKWYKAAASSGDPLAMLTLAGCYTSGKVGPEDWEAGFFWNHEAAKRGNPRAQMNTGSHYFSGKGIMQDYTRAAEWFRLAAERGMAEACVNLSEMCRLGMGISEPRPEEAKLWLQKAVALGNELARDLLKQNEDEERREREFKKKRTE